MLEQGKKYFVHPGPFPMSGPEKDLVRSFHQGNIHAQTSIALYFLIYEADNILLYLLLIN